MWLKSLLFLAGVIFSVSEPASASFLDYCPAPCGGSDNPSSAWTTYSEIDTLAACNETVLLDFAIYNPLDHSESSTRLYACTPESKRTEKRGQSKSQSCPTTNTTDAVMELAWSGSRNADKLPAVLDALEQVRKRISGSGSCDTEIVFGYSQETAVGVYIGSKVEHTQIAESQAQKFIEHLERNGVTDQTMIQHCGVDADYTVGIVADTTGDLAAVQKVVRGWDSAQCATGYQNKDQWSPVQLKVSGTMVMQKSIGAVHVARHLHPRATCSHIKVVSGDSCGSLAKKCGISGAKFEEYNKSKKNLCATLAVGQPVCCSKGTLPDLRPKPGKDGSCAAYTTINKDTCSKIAVENGLTISNLEAFNKQTWGWAGCKHLDKGVRMCLSKGSPPMPDELSNAVCGPQVPGTKKPGKGKSLADLNPCKLNACCNIWGQCGVTADFCTKSKSSTGAPGTAAPGKYGCISNCGTEIVNKKSPDSWRVVAYFEAWNKNRPCMTMSVDRIDTSLYNHIHFAFADITPDYHVNVSAVQDQFDIFVDMKGIKRILSFGGWSFSTELDTFPIFREGVTDANRQKFANNVASFIKKHNLDGVDFDWEYPGAPDIPGIPPGSKNDAANYVKFLKMVRKALPEGKTVSIAAPGSYWYLKGFDPIEDFEPLLDYMIFMTYDLHGQWDYGNQWATPGCTKGNCLRSHVNLTETLTSMSMITKAGMPTNKVVMGVTRYGRSFKMAKAGCTGPMCTFVGPESAAAKGRCTNTAGYIANAEIEEIIKENPTAKTSFDKDSESNILVYNQTEWVAYMDDDIWGLRDLRYAALKFGGVSDWAVDLKSMYTVPEAGPFPACDGKYDTLEGILKDVDKMPVYCVNPYAMTVLSKEFKSSLKKYHDLLDDGYDGKFKTYAKATKESMYYQINDYMTSRADDHWTCKKQKYVNCCSDCGPGGCRGGCDGSCGKGESGNRNETVSCPDKVPELSIGNKADTVYWILNDKDGFEKAIADKYGIDPGWLEFGNRRVTPGVGCGVGEDLSCGNWWIGYPQRKKDITIPNPKEIIGSALTNLTEFDNMLSSAATDAMAMLYVGETSDVTTASELPVFMTEFAVKSMKKVADAADEIDRDHQKEAIIGFLMAFLMLVPALGEAAGSFGLTTVGRVLVMTGAAGDAALGMYGVVEDPKSAVISLFIALLGVKGEAGFEKAAGIRREMSSKESAALGSFFQEKSKTLQSVQRRCI
ncbi:glycoside hydrolase [Aspergillus steynii IBT 23096]|uniref:chitinase n=1 Tax=Aspergillus steynii IBT 23096 TaxID=1392250 RepID=A0A2I2GE57_9EURO|nr:glycoside hydrolase [Aspergillus steynii IBT 23096]PLB51186.1 glycoside hydrolase [Aspergillus steynii IBT 23096]